MTTIITRLFANLDDATAAKKALLDGGYAKSEIDLVADGESAFSAMRKAGVYEAAARNYAHRLNEGAALVILRASFGTAQFGIDTLDALNPIPDTVKHTEVYVPRQDPPMMSGNRNLPELLHTTIMSDGIMPPSLSRSFMFSSLFGMPTVVESGPRAALLEKNPTPFSSLFGLPLLTSGKTLLTKAS